MTNNWTENLSKTTYKHKSNPYVVVLIRRNIHSNNPKYFVLHSHPAPNNRAIMQEPEGAMSMESARKKAEKHLKHWGNYQTWQSDPDWNKLGKKGA